MLVSGDVSSTAHEAILRQSATKYFGTDNAEFELHLLSLPPPRWAMITDLMLRAVAETQTSTTVISTDGIDVRGITSSPDAWSNAIARVREFLPPGMRLNEDILVIRKAESLESLCRQRFSQSFGQVDIEFQESSSILSSNSFGQLDSLIELMTDCPGSVTKISGHTDSTGYEPSNLALSEERAESVVTYLIAHGINADRLSALGAGSSDPVADNSDARMRHKNRRIEFELSFRTEQEY